MCVAVTPSQGKDKDFFGRFTDRHGMTCDVCRYAHAPYRHSFQEAARNSNHPKDDTRKLGLGLVRSVHENRAGSLPLHPPSLTIVNARNPRATLAGLCSVEKLLRIFPCVSSTKCQYPPTARTIPITSAIDTDHLVTLAQRSTPPFAMLLYTRNDECWHTKAIDIAPKPPKMVGRMNVVTSERSMSGFSLRRGTERRGDDHGSKSQGSFRGG